MSRLERAAIPVLVLVLALGAASLVYAVAPGGASSDFYNLAPVVGDADCVDRSATPGALHDFGGADPSCGVVASVAVVSPVNMPDVAGRKLFGGTVIEAPGDIQLISISNLAPCGGIDECNCDSANLLATRLFNSLKRKAAPLHADNGACPTPFDPTGGMFEVTQVIGAGFPGDCDVSFADECADATVADVATLTIGVDRFPGACGMEVTKDFGVTPGSLAIEPTGACRIGSNFLISAGGNSVGVDLLPEYLLQINRGGNDGVVTVEVRQSPAGSFSSFTVNTTGKTDDQVLESMCAGFAGLGFNLSPILATPHEVNSPLERLQPGTYASGKKVLYIRDAGQKVNAIRVTGVVGQEIIAETSAGNTKVPAMSGWGVILLALLILTSGYWLFRRRYGMSRA